MVFPLSPCVCLSLETTLRNDLFLSLETTSLNYLSENELFVSSSCIYISHTYASFREQPPSHKRPFREYVNEDAFWNEVVVAGADKAEMNAFRRKWTLQKLQTVLRALGKGAREVLLEDGDIMLYCSLLGALGVSESDL